MKLSNQVKLSLFNALKKEPDVFGNTDEREHLIDFLSEIWPLSSMPSQDGRFNDALGDAFQHLVNNDDWDIDYVFLRRFNLFEDDDTFQKFLEVIVSPKFKQDENEIVRFVLLINRYIQNEGFSLVLWRFNEDGLPVYLVSAFEETSGLPIGIAQNAVPFLVDPRPNGRADRASSHKIPGEFPAIVLAFNAGWNDYRVKSEFSMFYYVSSAEMHYLGEIKIANVDDNILDVSDIIPTRFSSLSDDFYSLGQSINFYKKLKDVTGHLFESILFAVRDCAFFPDIHEMNERKSNFRTSLIRTDQAERLLREARYKVYDYNLSSLYSFEYRFQPVFADDELAITFQFGDEGLLPNRIYAIIGKNGSGKTQLITSIPNNIAKKQSQHFIPQVPVFSRVIAVSYSLFDRFSIPQKTAQFNYVYCGLRSEGNEPISEDALVIRFHDTWKKIIAQARTLQWKKILLTFLEEKLVDEFLVRDLNAPGNNPFTVEMKGFNKVKNQLSSGQAIILYIISEIVAHIRYDSLLLYDEPEIHLHPNAITQLMNTIYELVEQFESYCIITTHSPLIIQELSSRNVYVLERQDKVASIRRIGIESFGENLTTLTEEVFGNKEIPKVYKKIIKGLADSGKTYNEILSLLQFDEVPLSLNTRMYIKSMMHEES